MRAPEPASAREAAVQRPASAAGAEQAELLLSLGSGDSARQSGSRQPAGAPSQVAQLELRGSGPAVQLELRGSGPAVLLEARGSGSSQPLGMRGSGLAEQQQRRPQLLHPQPRRAFLPVLPRVPAAEEQPCVSAPQPTTGGAPAAAGPQPSASAPQPTQQQLSTTPTSQGNASSDTSATGTLIYQLAEQLANDEVLAGQLLQALREVRRGRGVLLHACVPAEGQKETMLASSLKQPAGLRVECARVVKTTAGQALCCGLGTCRTPTAHRGGLLLPRCGCPRRTLGPRRAQSRTLPPTP